MNKEREAPWWLCNECADRRGLEVKKELNTVIKGLCGNCEREDETFLTPLEDFRKKQDGSRDVQA